MEPGLDLNKPQLQSRLHPRYRCSLRLRCCCLGHLAVSTLSLRAIRAWRAAPRRHEVKLGWTVPVPPNPPSSSWCQSRTIASGRREGSGGAAIRNSHPCPVATVTLP
jgi:hypothetical protein